MNSRLEEKLLLLRARKYIDKIQGINNIVISLDNGKEFQWHRKICNSILKGNEKPEYKLDLPINKEDVYSYVQSEIHIGESNNYYMFFEGLVIISFTIVNLRDFLYSHFSLNKTFDISVLSLNPMKIIVISEEEYELSIFDKVI
ncbi:MULTISPECIES: hypothetical protein [Xenorhabdus]|uniref:hypothetical protein n=1 Tax=Xenorhabdus TaxID=626 RepID=UPI000649C4B0|nr:MULTISPECIES: hypothetical protein [Xenorhabdus]KLU14469.1 hypothetical protein AAY47_16220 [Xenorhabdus griffiniae]KOP32159.1 hypothetical protein AFK69_16915 [Xenorhabdus sp. GDc328]